MAGHTNAELHIAPPGRTGSCMTGLWLLDDWTPLGLECICVEWKVLISGVTHAQNSCGLCTPAKDYYVQAL